MPSEATNDATRREWRALGFFYDRDDQAGEWRVVGSRAGQCRFRDLVLEYAADARHDATSEHEHYGPYLYLELMTWPEPGMDSHAIHGSLQDLRKLAALLDAAIEGAAPGMVRRIGDEYAEGCPYSLVLQVRDDDFDPASADTALGSEAG